ncbi:EcsC family protein [Paraburkholderia tropica]|uniref:EcsC family protein n=1 Tax=Paraburkholderia tropica TaxID=92647 RepID=UPI003D2CCE97
MSVSLGAENFALTIELPISTTIMLRSIADIARSEGENLSKRDAQIACVQVLAFGGKSKSDDGAETGYFAVRQAMAVAVTDAVTYLAKGSSDSAVPVMIQLIRQIAQRFGVQVGEKAAAQIVPILGAAGGATINTLFMNHFQDMARGHFTVRRLERKYGAGFVKAEYERLALLAKPVETGFALAPSARV